MAAQAWNSCCVALRTSFGIGAQSPRSCALSRARVRAFRNRNLQIMVSLLSPGPNRHPRLAEVGARLLEQVDLGHDSLVVVPVVGEEELEVGLLLLDVRFEVGEHLLIPGEDLLETPHLVLGQLQLTANVPPLPELAVVPSQRARPVRSGLGGRAWHHEDAG